ncbi:hypothetical protein [Bifidobacterium myosotis]|uniref:Tetratricopeptide repeat protein n=1 Tax=Bifidobacterium myosotis TaxID=1630166 RepID=A0A5M9ZGB8_9BIFI|nr:hypothetical protein [Bifidobacterium myosotis]KAA8825109.1 hypothetical protein EMO91_12840 [Bifidobacterium myosotis]
MTVMPNGCATPRGPEGLRLARRFRDALDAGTGFEWTPADVRLLADDRPLGDALLYATLDPGLSDDMLAAVITSPRSKRVAVFSRRLLDADWRDPAADYDPWRVEAAIRLLAPAAGPEPDGSGRVESLRAHLMLYTGRLGAAADTALTALDRDPADTLAMLTLTAIESARTPAKGRLLAGL